MLKQRNKSPNTRWHKLGQKIKKRWQPKDLNVFPKKKAEEKSLWEEIKNTKKSLTLKQKISYIPRPGQVWLEVEFYLTTAYYVSRKKDSRLNEIAYMLRLEILNISKGVRWVGFNLGPWQVEDLNLEKGSIFFAEPLWLAFRPACEVRKGRCLLLDIYKNRLLDLPWETKIFVPGIIPSSSV